jgi:hypothetical protein
MMLNVVFGGIGVGFINLIMFTILTVFLVGMMIGRTPEFLGKMIEAREMKLVTIAVLVHPYSILGFTALAALLPATLQALGNQGPHRFSEVLYGYTSGTANNGSAFAGLSTDTPFFNATIGFAMLIGRYLILLPMLAGCWLIGGEKDRSRGAGDPVDFDHAVRWSPRLCHARRRRVDVPAIPRPGPDRGAAPASRPPHLLRKTPCAKRCKAFVRTGPSWLAWFARC